jgi:hypothetical protein
MSDDALDREEPRRSWRWPFGWLGLFALAWLVYELTHSPALAAVFVCLKFGWEDFQAARWLCKNDPAPARRRGLFWLYSAWGLWKTAVVAFLMSLAFAAVTPRNPFPQAVPQALVAFLGTFLTTLLGFGLSAAMTAFAVAYAWRGGFRLWLDSGVHRARRLDFWPPTPFCEAGRNRLGHLLLTAIALAALLVLVAVLTAAAAAQAPGGFLVGFVLSITAPVAVVVCREVVSRKVWAESPAECWPEEWDAPEQPWRDDPPV